VLYELLSGTLPFSIAGDPFEVLERRVHEEPVPIADVAPNVPEPIAAVTMRALERDSAARFPSAEAFGVAVADAATEAFGAGWVGRADLTLLATGPIAAAAGPATTTVDTSAGVAWSDAGVQTGRETMVAGKGAPVPQDAPMRVRATAVHRAGGAHIDQLRPEDLVRVDDLIKPPKPPRLSMVAATLLFAGLVAVGVRGIGTPDPSGPIPSGRVEVAGVDVASDRTATVDLAHDVPVRVSELPARAEGARYVRLGFSVMGVDLPPSRSAELTREGGSFSADIDAQRVRVLVSGKVTAELRFLDAEKDELLAHEFRFDSDRPFYLTFNGLIGLFLLAFVLSYGWSLTQPLRRGRARRSAYVSIGILGAVVGAAVVDLGWAIVGPQPTLASVSSGVALGALGALALGRVILMTGRRRRLALAQARREPPAPDS
jgi:serine/threonine-protein kinase